MDNNDLNGIIVINKPKDFTSHDVVAKLRGILSMKKIGHTGTLDPDAVGVLPVCIGKGTKLSDLLTASDKEYIAEVTLGAETDTQDSSGAVLRTADVSVSENDILSAVQEFIGDITQIPPMYSAIKQDGKKLYELARKGIEVERKPREISISQIEILHFDLPHNRFTMRVACSKGTYIRTLCHDIGLRLGCYAYMSELSRTKSGQFGISEAVTLEEVETAVRNEDFSFILPIDGVLTDYPPLYISESKAQKVRHGGKIRTPGLIEGTVYRVYGEDGSFLTVSCAENGMLKILKTFYQ